MHGIHKDREAFKFRKRKKKTAEKTKMRQQQMSAIHGLWLQNLEEEASNNAEGESVELCVDTEESGEEDFMDIEQLPAEPNAKEVAALYSNSKLSKTQAIQLLQLYRIRHKVSDAAFGDLLEMLQRAFLPANNTLPRTLYSFAKALDEDCVLKVVHSTSNFVVFDVKSQINGVVTQNYASFTKHRQGIRNSQFFDHCGFRLRHEMDDFISIAVFTDGGPITKSSNQQIWPLVGFVLDLPPKLQKSIENVIWIGLCVCEKSPDWSNFFEEISPQFLQLSVNPIKLQFDRQNAPSDGVVAPQFKVRIMEILADNIGRADILMMRKPPGYSCCPVCQITGEYNHQAKTVLYPDSAFKLKSRENWTVDYANGIKALSPLIDIVGVGGILNIVQVDCMHTVYGGIYKHMIHAMYGKSTVTAQYFDSAFTDMIVNRPREIHRRVRSFKLLKRFKTNEFKTILHFVMPILLPGYADLKLGRTGYRMAINCLLLTCGMQTLAKKDLTRDDIKFAHQVFQRWHNTLAAAFGVNFLTFKAHQVLHLATLSLIHGSCVHRTCFAGESVVGFALGRITSPKDALWQISERIKRIPAKSIDISTKEWFSTTKFVECDQFKLIIGNLSSGNNNHAEIKAFFSARYPNQAIRMSRRVKLDHMVLVSKALHNDDFKDSVVYVKSSADGTLRPTIAEVFFEVDGTKHALVRPLNTITTLSRNLRWIRRDQQAFNLLTDRRAFPGCYLVEPETGELHDITMARIITKGIVVQSANENFVFPIFAFDHD